MCVNILSSGVTPVFTGDSLNLNIEAPMPNAPSMTGAIEMYVREVNKIK